jgi:hypothetical protein
MDKKRLCDVLEIHTADLMGIEGVVGVAEGICDDKPCIRVFVSPKSHELVIKIPANLEGYRVCVEETGEFRAL